MAKSKSASKKYLALSPLERAIKNYEDGNCYICGREVLHRQGRVYKGQIMCSGCWLNEREKSLAMTSIGKKNILTQFANKIEEKKPKAPKKKPKREYIKIVYTPTESNRRKH